MTSRRTSECAGRRRAGSRGNARQRGAVATTLAAVSDGVGNLRLATVAHDSVAVFPAWQAFENGAHATGARHRANTREARAVRAAVAAVQLVRVEVRLATRVGHAITVVKSLLA